MENKRGEHVFQYDDICVLPFPQNLPPDLSQCVFVIEQALSVRALQELVTSATNDEAVSEKKTNHQKLKAGRNYLFHFTPPLNLTLEHRHGIRAQNLTLRQRHPPAPQQQQHGESTETELYIPI